MDGIANKIICAIAILLLTISCKNNNEGFFSQEGKIYLEKNHDFMQKMILCRCLYSIDSDLKVNEGSSGYFFNRSNYDPEVYYKIDSLIPLYKRKFVGLTGAKLGVAECISLSESDTIKKEIIKMDKFLATELK